MADEGIAVVDMIHGDFGWTYTVSIGLMEVANGYRLTRRSAERAAARAVRRTFRMRVSQSRKHTYTLNSNGERLPLRTPLAERG
jgi:hypothetical protein